MIKTLGANLDFESTEQIKQFITSTDTGFYFGKDVKGNTIIASVIKGEKLSIRYEDSSNSVKKVEYNKNGEIINRILRG